jgi:signal transduction histidine kinase
MLARLQHAGPVLFLGVALFLAGHLSGIFLWSALPTGEGAAIPPSTVLFLLTALLILLAVACCMLALVALRLRRMAGERTRLYQAEHAARAAAEEAIQTRDEFLSLAAHELRNPLTSLYGFSEYLSQSRAEGKIDDGRLQRGLTVINRQATKLSRLIDELLEVSRLEMNRLTLRCEPADLVEVVDRVVELARAHHPNRPVHVTYPSSAAALIDVQRMEEVVANLVDNALKFSPEGSPIEIEVAHHPGEQIELAVRDYGPGVDDAHREQIFERFLSAERGTHSSGLGVGLYVSRAILGLHGGELIAEFPEDGGSRFVLRVPACTEALGAVSPLDKAG